MRFLRTVKLFCLVETEGTSSQGHKKVGEVQREGKARTWGRRRKRRERDEAGMESKRKDRRRLRNLLEKEGERRWTGCRNLGGSKKQRKSPRILSSCTEGALFF